MEGGRPERLTASGMIAQMLGIQVDNVQLDERGTMICSAEVACPTVIDGKSKLRIWAAERTT